MIILNTIILIPEEFTMSKIIPAPLKSGDEVRIIAPSTGIKIIGSDTRDIAKQRFEAMGLKVTFGKNTTDDNFDMLGSSEVHKRAEDINDAFADSNVKAIFTIIGGFNSNQVLPFLDYEMIKSNPKIICGFSDITALLNGIYAKTGLATFLGPHYSSFGMKFGFEYSLETFKKILFEQTTYPITPSREWSDDLWFINQDKREFIKNDGHWCLQSGNAKGTIIGGNLGTLTLLLGTPYWSGFKSDTVLLAEDCFSSSADAKNFLRNLQAIAYQPDFQNVKGILIGRFQKASAINKDILAHIISSIPQLRNIPIIANLDFGHTTPLLTLPIGGTAEICDNEITIKY